MPNFLLPKQSGNHRFACVSLYRAILRQCNSLRVIGLDSVPASHLVRSQFRKLRELQSPTQILNALRAGREALDLFHSCNQRNLSGISRLKALVDQTVSLSNRMHERRRAQAAAHVPENREHPIAKRRAEARANQRPAALRPHPNTRPIESRPNLHVPRRRHVPVFVNARGLPFLRTKKPQSPRLSRALRSILEMRWNRILRRDKLRENIDFAEDEDVWDALVAQQQNTEENYSTEKGHQRVDYDPATNASWARPSKQCLYETQKAIEAGDKDAAARAERLWGIVLKERDLAQKEGSAGPRGSRPGSAM